MFARAARKLFGNRIKFAAVEWGRAQASSPEVTEPAIATRLESRPAEAPVAGQIKKFLSEPIREIFDAARYLDAAVSAHMAGKHQLADELIRLADMPAITEWTESLWGPGGLGTGRFGK